MPNFRRLTIARKLHYSEVVSDNYCMWSDENLANECIDHCLTLFVECREYCHTNSTCTYDCNYAHVDCQMSCPCFQDCPQGCDGCHTAFCQCNPTNPESSPDFIECKESEWKLFVFTWVFYKTNFYLNTLHPLKGNTRGRIYWMCGKVSNRRFIVCRCLFAWLSA